MVTSVVFVLRLAVAWFLVFLLGVILFIGVNDGHYYGPAWPFVMAALAMLVMVVTGAFSHVRRVRLIAGQLDAGALANRQRRQIEVPLERRALAGPPVRH